MLTLVRVGRVARGARLRQSVDRNLFRSPCRERDSGSAQTCPIGSTSMGTAINPVCAPCRRANRDWEINPVYRASRRAEALGYARRSPPARAGADYLLKDHKPSAIQGEARLRGLYRIISSKTIPSAPAGARAALPSRSASVASSPQRGAGGSPPMPAASLSPRTNCGSSGRGHSKALRHARFASATRPAWW